MASNTLKWRRKNRRKQISQPKVGNRSRIYRFGAYVLENTVTSLIILVIVFVFTLVPLSFSLFNTAQTMREQYSLMDAFFSIYNGTDNSDTGLKLSNNIVIVNIQDVYDRKDISGILAEVYSARPRAIGLDVTFYQEKDPAADSLISIIASCPNVISPCVLLHETGEDSRIFEAYETSFYVDSVSQKRLGFVNIDLVGATLTCRHFVPEMHVMNMAVPNFAAAISKVACPEAYDNMKKRHMEKEYINYDRTAFLSVDAKAIHENSDLLTDKIVLIGDKGDLADQYMTPMEPRQPGVEIHAHAIDTIINGKFVDVMPEGWSWFLAFCIIFLFLPLAKFLSRNEWIAIFIPVIQTLAIISAVFIGYCIFVSFHYYVKVIYAMLAIGFMDVGTGLYRKTRSCLNTRHSKSKQSRHSLTTKTDAQIV